MEEVRVIELDLESKIIRVKDFSNTEFQGFNLERNCHEKRFIKIGVENSPFFVIDATFNYKGEAYNLIWEPVDNKYFITRVSEFENFFSLQIS